MVVVGIDRDDLIWPLVGREDDVSSVLRAHRDRACHGVLLTGASGVGTTRVLDEVLAELRRSGRPHNRIAGSEGNRAVPYGALAHVRPPGDDGSSMFDRIRRTIGSPRTAGDRFVTGIDEIALLDDQTLGLLSDLLLSGLAFVVATMRDGQRAPAALLTVERTCRVRRHWLAPLDLHETLELVDHALPGPVEGATAMALWESSGGTPLFVRDAVEGSRQAGVLVEEHGVWTLHGPPVVTDRLAAVFASALDALEPDDRELVELLAVAAPVAVDALEREGLLAGAVRLEAAGLVTTRFRDGVLSVDVAQPLLAAQLRNGLPPLRRRALLPRALALVGDNETDVLRTVSWQLECGQQPTADALEAAAALAHTDSDLEVSERLAALALEQRATVPALLVRAEALHGLCRFAEAEDVMRAADELADDEPSLLRLAIVRHRLRLWGEHDADRSEEALDELLSRVTHPLVHDMAEVARANTLVFTGRPSRVLEQRSILRSTEDLPALGLMFPEGMALMLLGRLDTALEVTTDGDTRRASTSPTLPIGHPALYSLGLGMVLVERGEYAEADRVLADAYRATVATNVPQLHTWLALARGRCALGRGQVADARRWFVEGRAVSERSRFAMGTRNAVTGLQVCAALVRDLDTLRHLDETARALPDDQGLLWPERMLGAAWSAVAHGRPDEAVRLLRIGADEAAARGEVLLHAQLLYETARLGFAAEVTDELESLGDVPEGMLAAARRAFVRGAARRDAGHLALAESTFADIGALLAAAESACVLATVLHAQDRRREALQAAARAGQYRRDLEEVSTPALVVTEANLDLSPREREIAELAVGGLSSKAIAAQLHLSVRTVSNHLQSVYTKLGVSGRAELADVLG